MVIVFFFPRADFQRTMTICAASLSRGNLGHGHRLFVSDLCQQSLRFAIGFAADLVRIVANLIQIAAIKIGRNEGPPCKL